MLAHGLFSSSSRHQLTKELFEIACGTNLCKVSDIQKAHELIANGADVCYYEGGETIIHGLIKMRSTELLKAAFTQNPNACKVIPNLIYRDPTLTDDENYFAAEQDPLHKAAYHLRYANTKTNNDIYNLIAEHYDISDKLPALYECIEILYHHASALLKQAIEQNDTRPLLILFGENHDSLFSSLVQCIVIFVAHTLRVNKIFREEDGTRLMVFNDYLARFKSGELIENSWKSAVFVRIFMDKLSLHVSSSDHGSQGGHLVKYDAVSQTWLPVPGCTVTDENIRYRNNIIANEYRTQSGSRSFAQVGSSHLYGICVEEKIADDFNVVVFDSAKCSVEKFFNRSEYSRLSDQFRVSDKVVNLTRCISNFDEIECLLNAVHPTWLVEAIFSHVMKIHKQEHFSSAFPPPTSSCVVPSAARDLMK